MDALKQDIESYFQVTKSKKKHIKKNYMTKEYKHKKGICKKPR